MAFSAIRRVSRRSASPDRIAAVTSVWIRSLRVTGIGTSGAFAPGAPSGPSSLGQAAPTRMRPPFGRSALRRPCVLLALCFLALALHAGLLVVLATAGLSEDPRLLDLLVEAAQGALERLVLAHSDFCQSRIHLLGLLIWFAPGCVAQRARQLLPDLRPHDVPDRLPEPPECSRGSVEGQTWRAPDE